MSVLDNRLTEQLYEEYLPKIYRYVYYRVHHKQTAEDLTSTVFLKAASNFDKFKAGSLFGPWIYQIARNTLIDYSRTKKVTWDLDEAMGVASSEDLLLKTDITLKVQVVKETLNQLNPLAKEVVMMRVWDELSHKEIAQILGISEDNSKVLFSRAAMNLKKLISPSL
jgi:RNA polymerase sigma-70 factor (ECF subfamily)